MGELIPLRSHRPERARTPEVPPAFFFDVSCPLSYVTGEQVERHLGEIEWVAVDGAAVRDGREAQASRRARAEARARLLRLPLVWPDRFPEGAPCALRAAAYACELGAGQAFALAASRLAFCGGFDLEDPETLTEAAAAAGVPLDGCLAAAGETWRDGELAQTAKVLREQGIVELPAITIDGRWFGGEGSLLAAVSSQAELPSYGRPLAPVG